MGTEIDVLAVGNNFFSKNSKTEHLKNIIRKAMNWIKLKSMFFILFINILLFSVIFGVL